MFDNYQMSIMNEYGGMEEWGLQAVVNNPTLQSCFEPLALNNNQQYYDDDNIDGLLFNSPHLFETSTVVDELEELYKPFYPINSPQTILATSISIPSREVIKDNSQKLPAPAPTTTIPAAKSKKRNQRKKMVFQVTADGLSSDMWAWRKYGQKPIKGSPYPRSYYRCSSSKGCLARKQVEQSSSEPGMFIITYTSEHSHAHPTRRSSLAGSTRNKSSAPKKRTTTTTTTRSDSCSSSTTVLSPTTPLTAACIMEDKFLQHATSQERRVEEEEEQQQQMMIKDDKDNEVVIANMMSSIDLFPSLEELDRLTSNMDFDHWFSDQIPVTFPC